eukprot:jgi/Orpsp1_1/1187171/evm.model.d7180000055913.2
MKYNNNNYFHFYFYFYFYIVIYIIIEELNLIKCCTNNQKYLYGNEFRIEKRIEDKFSSFNEINNFHKKDVIDQIMEVNLLKKNKYFNGTESEKDDLYHIKNYKGEELDSEWDWVKNISVVYTWVDGSDINRLDLKYKYNGGLKTTSSRDRSADELRYSLRSLEKYLPWHNGKIYIVTDDQIPSWLDINHPRIKMIYHRDIIPEYVRPTFDSNTIELYFDKIPGITEIFLYLNDDVFFNNYIHPCFFFTGKEFYPKVYRNRYSLNISKEHAERIIERNSIHEIYDATVYITHTLIKKYFDRHFDYHYLEHNGFIFYRDLLDPFRQFFKEELKDVIADKFRNPYKLQSIYLYQTFIQYLTLNKNFLKGKLPENRTLENYSLKIVYNDKNLLVYGEVTDHLKRNNEFFDYFKTNPNILVYNLNDKYSKMDAFYQLTEYMITRYPSPSSFEKKKYIEIETFIPEMFKKLDSDIRDISSKVPGEYDRKNLFSKDILRQNAIKEYIRVKHSLSKSNKNISDREEEEINYLLNYRGEVLDEEWNWAKNISFVYRLNHEKCRNDTGKYIELQKLFYSIGSIEKYLPWSHGKIYLIGNREDLDEMEWSNLNSKMITLISEDEIIPTYFTKSSSYSVEMYLDKIPDLSERFVYMKSDHFFINYTHPRFFFSRDYFPKYNLKRILNPEELKIAKSQDKPFIHTYEIIKKYFGKSYVKGYRYFENAPLPLYRDLFDPVRQLFHETIGDDPHHDNHLILPLYLVLNYNLYGTDQPFYPNYVSGYGKIKESELPLLNNNRTISYYGFDTTTREIFEKTLLTDITVKENFCEDHSYIEEIVRSKILFISFRDIYENGNPKNIKCFFNYLSYLYGIKSINDI